MMLVKYSSIETANGTSSALDHQDLLTEELLENIKVRTSFVTRLDRAQKIQAVLLNGTTVDQLLPKKDVLSKIEKPASDVKYSVGDEFFVNVDGFIREAVCETLFKRDVDDKSISQLIVDSVLKCPIDLRRFFLGRIHVVGGASMCQGFLDRLKHDLIDLLHDPRESYRQKIQVDDLKFFKPFVKENCVAWLGGSIFGGLEILPHRSITKEQFKSSPVIPDWTDAKANENSSSGNDANHKR